MSFAQSKDERLLAINVRTQVEMDKESGGLYRFAANGVKQYAEKLRKEIERRRATGSNSPKSILSDSTGCEPLVPWFAEPLVFAPVVVPDVPLPQRNSRFAWLDQ